MTVAVKNEFAGEIVFLCLVSLQFIDGLGANRFHNGVGTGFVNIVHPDLNFSQLVVGIQNIGLVGILQGLEHVDGGLHIFVIGAAVLAGFHGLEDLHPLFRGKRLVGKDDPGPVLLFR